MIPGCSRRQAGRTFTETGSINWIWNAACYEESTAKRRGREAMLQQERYNQSREMKVRQSSEREKGTRGGAIGVA